MAKLSFDTARSEMPNVIESAVEATLKYIGTNKEGQVKLPKRQRVRLSVGNQGNRSGPKLEFREESSISGFFEYHWQFVSRLQEVRDLSFLLAMTQYINLPANSIGFIFREKNAEEDAQKNGWDVTRPVLESCIERQFHGESKAEYLPWIIDRIEAGAKKFYLAERHTGPIVKLQIDGPDEILLDEDIRLRRLTEKERTRLCDPDDLAPSNLTDFEAEKTFWVFEMDVYHITEEEPKYYPATPEDIFQNYLTVIRLIKPGSFYLPHVTIQDLPGASAYFGVSWSMPSKSHNTRGFVKIEESELPVLLKWFSKLVPILASSKDERLNIAIGRFNESFLRQKYYDITLDSAIGLEALLLGDQQTSNTHVLMLRGSVLLGDTLEKRQEAFKKFQKFLKMRNDLVHGNVIRKHFVPSEEALELIRSTFLALLPLFSYGSQKNVLHALDAYLLSSPTNVTLESFVKSFCKTAKNNASNSGEGR
ncbi:MAG: HEPN domain-containing protein [Candidatus Thermoplasmatota archaeon]|nr:HEPN domain-containing protein [Candidatus Thermoplasmatota archaeon]